MSRIKFIKFSKSLQHSIKMTIPYPKVYLNNNLYYKNKKIFSKKKL